MINKTISLAEAKKRLSELVARAAFGQETFLITRRGRPAAILKPVQDPLQRPDLADVRGWLPATDSFFAHLQEARRGSRTRGPRAVR